MTTDDPAKRLLEFMTHADRAKAGQLVEQLLGSGMQPEELLTDVLNPALVRIGDLWSSEEASLSQTFVAAKIAEDILVRCLPGVDASQKPRNGAIVIGNIEDDFHSLGRRIVGSFLRFSGWEVHDLGNDVLAEDFVARAIEVHASVIGVSAMMQTTALNIGKVRRLLDEQGLGTKIKLAVGGAVFNWRPELVEQVGGDGTASHAAAVDALFQQLQSAASQETPP